MIPKEIKIISLSFFIIFFSYNGVQQFLTSYFSELNELRTGFFSLVLIYFFLLISSFFSGFLVSKFGAKKCLIFGAFFYSLFIFALLAKSPIFIFLASALLGFGASILWTAQGVSLVRFSEQNHYGRNSGFFTALFQIGSVLGIIALGVLVSRLSFQSSFLIFGALPLIAVVFLFTIKNAESKNALPRNGFRALKRVLTNAAALRFSLIWLSFSLIIASVIGKFPLEVKKHFGLGSIGFVTPIFYFLPIVFSYYAGRISDEKGRKLFLVIAYILVLSGLILFMSQIYFELDKIFFILSFLLISLGFAFYSPMTYALLGDISSDRNLEYLTALSLLVSNLGFVLVFLSNIFLPDIFSYLIAFLIIITSLIIVFPMLKLNINTIKEKINS